MDQFLFFLKPINKLIYHASQIIALYENKGLMVLVTNEKTWKHVIVCQC